MVLSAFYWRIATAAWGQRPGCGGGVEARAGDQEWRVQALAPDPQQLTSHQPLSLNRPVSASAAVQLNRQRSALAFLLSLIVSSRRHMRRLVCIHQSRVR